MDKNSYVLMFDEFMRDYSRNRECLGLKSMLENVTRIQYPKYLNDNKEIGDFLNQEQIQSKLVPKSTATAFAAIVVDKNGQNRVTVFQGAQLSVEDILSLEDCIKETVRGL